MSGNGMAKGGAVAPPLAPVVSDNPASSGCGYGSYLRRSGGLISLGPGRDNCAERRNPAVLVHDACYRQGDLRHQSQIVGFLVPHLDCARGDWFWSKLKNGR